MLESGVDLELAGQAGRQAEGGSVTDRGFYRKRVIAPGRGQGPLPALWVCLKISGCSSLRTALQLFGMSEPAHVFI